MDERLLRRFKSVEQRSMTILMIVVPIVHSVLDDTGITFGLALGGCLELLLFYLFRKAAEKIIDGGGRDKARALLIALAVKLAVLAAALGLAIHAAPLDPIALVVGVGLIVFAVILEIFLGSDEE